MRLLLFEMKNRIKDLKKSIIIWMQVNDYLSHQIIEKQKQPPL